MKQFFAGLAVVCALPLTAVAQSADTIEDVIAQQLHAFTDRDLPRAFGFASPMIRRLFGSPENFGAMVSRGYPMVWDNREVHFLDLTEVDGMRLQKVLLRGPRGGLHVLEYEMLETPQGWQINGVDILPAPDHGV